MDPKISVIIPVYNAEKYLRKCLDSVMHQTIFDQLEVVAVNDGSTDASGSILADYADKYSNVNVMTQKNQGIAKYILEFCLARDNNLVGEKDEC